MVYGFNQTNIALVCVVSNAFANGACPNGIYNYHANTESEGQCNLLVSSFDDHIRTKIIVTICLPVMH